VAEASLLTAALWRCPNFYALAASIQNDLSRSLMSQSFLPRSVPNKHLQRTLRNKRFPGASVPTATDPTC
jgi:hypothetical protein